VKILLESDLRRPPPGAGLLTEWNQLVLRSIEFLEARVPDGQMKWHLYGRRADFRVLLLEIPTAEEADRLIKQDPLFPHAIHKLDLVCSSDALLEEIRSAVGEAASSQISSEPVPMASDFVPEPGMEYWLAKKELPALSISLTDKEHTQLLCDTAASKFVFDPEIELVDLNAVGRMAGYLLARGSEESVRGYIGRSPLRAHLTLDLIRLCCAEDAKVTICRPATQPNNKSKDVL
jgi:hypothetical protein